MVAETNGAWTTAHRLRGRACLFSVFKYDQAAFSGVPNVSANVRGKPVHDPRTNDVVFRTNAALIVADYLTSNFGLRCTWDEIDIPSLIAAANICDEDVPLKGGGTEKRYTINGTFDLDQTPSEILEKLAQAMAGAIIFSGGKWYIFAGAATAATQTITESDLRGPVTVQANRAARDLFNCVRATYIRPDADWQATDAPVLYGDAFIAQDGGQKFYTDLDFPFTTSGYTVQRLMKIALMRIRAQRTIKLQLNMMGLRLRPMDVVTFGTARLPSDTYRVTGWTLTDGGVDVTLEQESADIWAWDAATEEQDLGVVSVATLPSGVTLPAAAVTVTTPTDPVPASVAFASAFVDGATVYDAAWRNAGDTAWQSVDASGQTAVGYPTGPASFRMRGRSETQVGPWTEAHPPVAPVAIEAHGVAGGVAVHWLVGSDAVKVQIFVGGAAAGFDTAGLALTAIVPSGLEGTSTITLTAGETRRLWARAVSASGTWSGTQTAIVVTAGAGGAGGTVGTWPAPPDPSPGG
nr:phage tail protein [Roseomonas acroporae]